MIESIQNNDNRFESVGNEKMQDFENKFSSAEASFGVNRLKENTDSHNKIIRELFSNAVKLDTTETSHISETELRQTVIIGDDDRETVVPAVYPYNCICLLEIISATGKKYFGTGFLISPRCIITAGHCVNIKKEWVKSVEVSPGAKGNIRPFGSCKATRFRSVKGWTKKGNTNFDYGAIILPNTKLFDKVKSYLGYGLIMDKKLVELSGYPIDKGKTQWKSNGFIKKLSPYRIYYDLDTVKGHSGSPLFYKKGSNRIAVGVHSFGQNPNYSIRLNQEIMNRWAEWTKL